MKKIQFLFIILCLCSSLEATRLYYCFNKYTEEVTLSRSSDYDPITYTSYVYEIDASNNGIVTIHPFIDSYGIGMMEYDLKSGQLSGGRERVHYPVVKIDDNVFKGCYWITRINLPSTIKTIGKNAFNGCENLQYIHVDAKNPYFTSDGGVLYNKSKTKLIKFPAGKDASNFTIPKTVKEVAANAFERCKKENSTPKETGNPNFDKTINYQFSNVQALVGEFLYVAPRTGSNYCVDMFTNEPNPYYHNFMDYEKFYAGDLGLMITGYQYKYGVRGDIDCKVAGTHKDWLENHIFHVDKVSQIPNYKYMWVLHLTDLETGDKVKYVMDTEKANTQIDMENFPFIAIKHIEYLKSLIGTKLVFATNKYKYSMAEFYVPSYPETFKTDINTGEPIHYTTPYVKWTITNVDYDVYNMRLYFVVTDGKNTTTVAYDNPYTTKNPKYNVGNRVFPEKQWNELVAKYGEKHMSLIMQTEVTDDMTIEEKYMAGGRRLVRH